MPARHARRALDGAERALASLSRLAASPRAHLGLVALVLLVGLAARLPLVFAAEDVVRGHGDSWVFFNQAYADHLGGDVYPDAHRGSGWQLLLAATLRVMGFEGGGDWQPYGGPFSPEAARAALVAHALSASLALGAVAATYLLARELLSPQASLLAALLVALDPYHLSITTSAMSEPGYVALFTLALWSVLRARRHPAWLVATGALMALAHAMRINGLVMFVMALAFAALLLPRMHGRRATARWAAASVLVFLLVALPYLAWRAEHLPHAFDYGTNQRFWADDLWDLDDAYWTNHTAAEGAPRETVRGYFERHTVADAVGRLWASLQWQVFDLFGVGKWPPLEREGGLWVGTRPDGAALTPLVVALSLVASFTAAKRRAWWFVPLALAFTLATFAWIYPLVRSVRYFSPLIPLFTVFALAGWRHLAAQVARPHLVAFVLFGAHLALYGARLLALHAPSALADLAASADARAVLLPWTTAWLLLAAAGARVRHGSPRSRAPADAADDARS